MKFTISILLILTSFLVTGCGSLNKASLDSITEDSYQQARLEGNFKSYSPSVYPSLPAPKVKLRPEVKKEIEFFSRYNSSTVRKAIARKNKLGPVIENIFIDEGIPLELLNVAIIESSFNPNARSSAGAVGLWQFMKSTARVYGLEVGYLNDQRKDPILSTLAAARHLRDLYLAYTDWDLALAAYNAGSGGVDKAINKARTNDFWELSRRQKLKAQTRRYVAKFYAVMHITNNPKEYGLGEMRLAMNYPGPSFG